MGLLEFCHQMCLDMGCREKADGRLVVFYFTPKCIDVCVNFFKMIEKFEFLNIFAFF